MSAQSIASLGLDISSFDSAKKKQINDFIELFDKLSKYDGKTISPVLGASLTSFNNSISETNKLLDDLKIRLESLNNSSRSVVSPEVIKNYNNEVNEASNRTRKLGKDMEQVSDKTLEFGKGLTRAFGVLRNIAYILPGLGIAGIFNLAGEAIYKTAESLGLFTNETEKALDGQLAMNKALQDFVAIDKEVEKALSTRLGNQQALIKEVELTKAEGKSKLDLLETERKLILLRATAANQKFEGSIGFEQLQKNYFELTHLEDEYKRAEQRVAESAAGIHQESTYGFGNKDEEEKKIRDLAKLRFETARDEYTKQKGIIEANSDLSRELAAKDLQIAEFKAEEIRKLILGTAKIETAAVIDKNKIILSDERSTLEQRVAAIKSNFNAEQNLINAQKNYTLSKPDAKNADGSYTTESLLAIKDSSAKTVEARSKELQQIDAITEVYRQRRIKAETEINKNIVDQSAISNERVYKNEEKSLEERLRSYSEYIYERQRLQDLEYLKDIEQRGLTDKEKEKILSDKNTQQANIQADAEKQVYEIVYSSLRKQLKAIEDESNDEINVNKVKYAKDLDALNKQLDDKKISLDKYKEERRKLDYTDRQLGFNESISQDQKELERLKIFLDKEKELKIKAAEETEGALAALGYAKSTGIGISDAQNRYNKAVGAEGGIDQSITDTEGRIKVSTNKLNSDLLKKAQDKGSDSDNAADLKKRRDNIIIIAAFEKALYDTAKSLGDERFDREMKQIEEKQRAIDELYSSEIAAIEKSSLTAKDKAALDIQLDAQKMQFDKNAQAEQKRLSIEKAEFDKKLSIAHIILSTIEAAAAAGFITPVGIAIEAAGAAELAVAVGTQIPSYEDGGLHKGGLARTGEKGKKELVIEPYRSPYFVTKDNISYLPPNTMIISNKNLPVFEDASTDSSWEQTRWLARKLMPKTTRPVVKNTININLGFETTKRRILGN